MFGFFKFLFYLLFFSQANTNEIVLASTHDVQEVDVSTLLAAQPYTWIGEDFDKESRRFVTCLCVWLNHSAHRFEGTTMNILFSLCSSDDVDYRSSHTNIAQASASPFAPQQMAASSSMPWLGSGQTSMGASVVC